MKKKGILIVEDDQEACEMLMVIIGKKFPALEIHSAPDGRRALELFNEHFPEIVLTDIDMPYMNGIDLAKEIKSTSDNTRFIVMTAFSNKDFFERFREIGFVAYLYKPVQFGELFQAIGICLP